MSVKSFFYYIQDVKIWCLLFNNFKQESQQQRPWFFPRLRPLGVVWRTVLSTCNDVCSAGEMPFDISIPLVQRDMQGILSWIWSLALSKWTERSIVLGQFNEDQQCQLPSVPRLSYTGQGIFIPRFFLVFPYWSGFKVQTYLACWFDVAPGPCWIRVRFLYWEGWVV